MDALQCYMCLETVEIPLMCPKCSKLCCKSCITEWMPEKKARQQQQNCPHCRSDVQLDDFIAVLWVPDLLKYIESIRNESATEGIPFENEKTAIMESLKQQNLILEDEKNNLEDLRTSLMDFQQGIIKEKNALEKNKQDLEREKVAIAESKQMLKKLWVTLKEELNELDGKRLELEKKNVSLSSTSTSKLLNESKHSVLRFLTTRPHISPPLSTWPTRFITAPKSPPPPPPKPTTHTLPH